MNKEVKRNIFEIALGDLEIIECELLSASDNAYEMQIGCVDVLGDNFLRVQNALNIARKEHELLELYRKLSKELNLEIVISCDSWDGIYDCETLIETLKQIKELEEELKNA